MSVPNQSTHTSSTPLHLDGRKSHAPSQEAPAGGPHPVCSASARASAPPPSSYRGFPPTAPHWHPTSGRPALSVSGPHLPQSPPSASPHTTLRRPDVPPSPLYRIRGELQVSTTLRRYDYDYEIKASASPASDSPNPKTRASGVEGTDCSLNWRGGGAGSKLAFGGSGGAAGVASGTSPEGLVAAEVWIEGAAGGGEDGAGGDARGMTSSSFAATGGTTASTAVVSLRSTAGAGSGALTRGGSDLS